MEKSFSVSHRFGLVKFEMDIRFCVPLVSHCFSNCLSLLLLILSLIYDLLILSLTVKIHTKSEINIISLTYF